MMTPELVAFDLETTGLSAKTERVIEVGAVRFGLDGRTVSELQFLADPGIPVPLGVQRLTGISSADLAGQPSPVEVVAQLAGFCEGAALVGHGSAFDLAFCSQLAPASFGRREAFDTLELARILLPVAGSQRALGLSLGLRHERPHRALSDAQATAALFAWLLEEAAALRNAHLRRDCTGSPPRPPPCWPASSTSLWPSGCRPIRAADPGAPITHPAGAWGPPDCGGRDREGGGGDGHPGRRDRHPGRRDRDRRRCPTPAMAPIPSARRSSPEPWRRRRPGWSGRAGPSPSAPATSTGRPRSRWRAPWPRAWTGADGSWWRPAPGWARPSPTWRRSRSGSSEGAVARWSPPTPSPFRSSWSSGTCRRSRPTCPAPWAGRCRGRSHYISLRRFQRHLHRGDVGPRGPDLEVVRSKPKLLRWLDLTRTGDRAESAPGRHRARPLAGGGRSTPDYCLGSACANWRSGTCHMVTARRLAATAGARW